VSENYSPLIYVTTFLIIQI